MTATTNPVTVSLPGDRVVRVERVFNAARQRVWAAYTEPGLLSQWWAQGGRCDVVTYEFERGGHWRFVVAGYHNPEEEHGFEGRFREITPMDRIVRTFEWDGMPGHVAVETAEFEDLGDGRTRVVVESLFHTVDERDGMVASGMEQGLSASYLVLDRLLAAQG
jgi:uncharacterized protein YndB with AHSA1/START domain